MLRRFDLAFILRIVSFGLLSLLPGLLLSDILPVFFFPLFCAFSIAVAYALNKLPLRASLLFLLGGIFALLSFAVLGAIIPEIPLPASHRLFMHFSLSSWLLLATFLLCLSTTLIYLRAPLWKRLEPAVHTALLAFFLCIPATNRTIIYDRPAFLLLYGLLFLVTQLSLLLELGQNRRRPILNTLAFLPFLLVVAFFVLRGYSASAIAQNGGLLQPTLFKFDFSPFLTLQDEIKLNNTLVLITRTKQENTANLLRRIYLSGWSPGKGFFEADAPGTRPQETQVPSKPTKFPSFGFKLRSLAEQEYFIVNFDASSLIAMDYPIEVTPYDMWDSTAFNGAYAVKSESIGFVPFELYDSLPPTGAAAEGLSKEALAFYTSIDEKTNEKVRPLALSLTGKIPAYYDKILMLTTYLHDGDFRYSLKPGVAPDGDQLSYFLFNSKKGYCTYFAFSLCLMLRSIGIPARIAAGFFIQPDSGALDYYPIRANMAHAWVEVFFPNIGWISFDPTTTQLAQGESLTVATTSGEDDFIGLLDEIIANRSLLSVHQGEVDSAPPENPILRFIHSAYATIKRNFFYICLALLVIPLVLIYLYRLYVRRVTANRRRQILFVEKDLLRYLALHGSIRPYSQSRSEYLSSFHDPRLNTLSKLIQKAHYGPACSGEEANQAFSLFISFKKNHRSGNRKKTAAKLLVISCLIAFPTHELRAETADDVLAQAQAAIQVENWDSALATLNEGIKTYPDRPEFHYVLGTLYDDKGLYKAARTELLLAEKGGYADKQLYSSLSDVASALNLDEESLGYLRHYLELNPEDLFSWSNFGWLCYKTNRLQEGITTLHRVLDTYGPDSNVYVGLGNLYTAAFDYANAKKYYSLSIKLAEERSQKYLASVYYYNRSILEEIFYHFDEAYEDTKKSLLASERSAGYLMQGELELRRLDFQSALQRYLKAYSLDSTPLATLGLAETLIQAGYPNQALEYIRAAKTKSDLSWIANYGTTTNQYIADTHKLEKDIYKYLLNFENHQIAHSLSTTCMQSLRRINYATLFWYHDALFRIYTKKVAHYYETSAQHRQAVSEDDLYSNSYYFQAFDEWPKIAAIYLSKAEQIELASIEAAKPSYAYEKAALNNDTRAIEAAIRDLDPIWERNYLVKAFSKWLTLNKSTKTDQYRVFSYELFKLKPSAFITEKFPLPVSFQSPKPSDPKLQKVQKSLNKRLQTVGFISDVKASLEIEVSVSSDSVKVILRDKPKNRTIYAQTVNNLPLTAQQVAQVINSFSTSVFRTDLGL